MTPARVLFLLGVLVAVPCASAAVDRDDQKRAERMTLRLADVGRGWSVSGPASTQYEKLECAGVPKVESAITGFSSSAFLTSVHGDADKRNASSETRVFRTVTEARSWYDWARDRQAVCEQKQLVTFWTKKHGYTLHGLRHAPDVFKLVCSCPVHEGRAWQIGFTVTAPIHEVWLIDWVVVRSGRTVLAFYFFSAGRTFGPDGPRLVAKLLQRS